MIKKNAAEQMQDAMDMITPWFVVKVLAVIFVVDLIKVFGG